MLKSSFCDKDQQFYDDEKGHRTGWKNGPIKVNFFYRKQRGQNEVFGKKKTPLRINI